MITLKRINDTCFVAAAPLDHLECTAETADDAMAELRATLDIIKFAAHRMRIIRKATRCSFDPQLGCYVAELPAAGIAAQGFTRQNAIDRLMHGLKLQDELMAQEAAALAAKDELEPETPADAPGPYETTSAPTQGEK